MKAMQFEVDGPLTWADAPEPAAGAGEVLVEIAATAVNRADLMQRAGKYPPPAGESEVMGLECSGTIVALGADVEGWAVGDAVCALLAGGGYAERVAVPVTQLLPVPEGVSLEESAALPEAVCTVWSAVRDLPEPGPDALALVHGGSGGIGTMAIQLLRTRGYRVAVTASSRHHELCRALGAEIAIDYRSEDFVDAVLTATDGGGAEFILDVVGADYLRRNVDALALDGTLTVIATQGGTRAEVSLGRLMQRRVTLRAMTLRARPRTGGRGAKSEVVAQVREHVWPLLASGAVRPVIGATLPLADAERAHELMGSPQAPGGKILLVR
ncbi:putative NAD(P)H quinone oxidoreductase, PIG3 family [Agrococcus baldri]|uniref:NAD(P)H quinone oxidoreductase, PIG3 family n=1 Tax=Agrococcus baldri TaxID=153730 RepID=A0AA94HMR3_9MICO|nr:NAD(P)H-quinone oxidoreductase [Agrococcus baldri]SFS11572.1 putative NAD(P)H quinone oxidoreductase, PIG3 family [Agrococcus baldri]